MFHGGPGAFHPVQGDSLSNQLSNRGHLRRGIERPLEVKRGQGGTLSATVGMSGVATNRQPPPMSADAPRSVGATEPLASPDQLRPWAWPTLRRQIGPVSEVGGSCNYRTAWALRVRCVASWSNLHDLEVRITARSACRLTHPAEGESITAQSGGVQMPQPLSPITHCSYDIPSPCWTGSRRCTRGTSRG